VVTGRRSVSPVVTAMDSDMTLKDSNDERTQQGSIFDDKRLREVCCTKVICTKNKPKP